MAVKDITGRMLIQKEIDINKLNAIDLGGLSSGCYFVSTQRPMDTLPDTRYSMSQLIWVVTELNFDKCSPHPRETLPA